MEIYVPDQTPEREALARTTHMGISAHQDDIEIMAWDGILKCFGSDTQWFLGAVVTNGSGSPRDGLYANYTDEQMQKVRKQEQKKAAFVGEYGALALLDYTSAQVKDPTNEEVVTQLRTLIKTATPKVIYTHNLADKHDTHVGVTLKVIKALRGLEKEFLPEKVYGCEVWRGLDWMNDEDKVKFDVSGHPNIAASLLGVFDSQICGGKKYDLATMGRRIANATYAESHATDNAEYMIYAMDLTPLVYDPQIEIAAYVEEYINRFKASVAEKLKKLM